MSDNLKLGCAIRVVSGGCGLKNGAKFESVREAICDNRNVGKKTYDKLGVTTETCESAGIEWGSDSEKVNDYVKLSSASRVVSGCNTRRSEHVLLWLGRLQHNLHVRKAFSGGRLRWTMQRRRALCGSGRTAEVRQAGGLSAWLV